MLKNHPSFQSLCAVLFLLCVFLVSCKTGPFNLLKPASPHEAYERSLVNSGLADRAIGKAWIVKSLQVLNSPVAVNIPYRETGYFSSEKVQAAAFSFDLKQGQKLNVSLSGKPADDFMIYTDLWMREEDGSLEHLMSSDTVGTTIDEDIDETATFILRLQPELLAGGEYTLEINYGPSLAYPLESYQNNQIRSFFGDGRDADTRKHEGVDIFSAFRAPVLATAAGTVTRVNENNLGGRVVWFRPEDKNFSLYYAHLDEQTVSDGQRVELGDTLGRMGNTGNARTTPPHLHFGIYTRNGAVDPLPFIDPRIKAAPSISVPLTMLNSSVRTTRGVSLRNPSVAQESSLNAGTVMHVSAASNKDYRIELPDGTMGFVPGSRVINTEKPLSRYKASSRIPVYDRPDSSAAVKQQLQTGETVSILGSFGDYQLVADEKMETGWIMK